MTTNYSDLTPGTALQWKNTGGDYTMNLKALANAGIREGAKSLTLIDATKGFPEFLEIIAETKLQVAPTAGTACNVYVGFSKNATPGNENPGGLTGADAAVGNADQLPQLTFVGSLTLSNALERVCRERDSRLHRKQNILFLFFRILQVKQRLT
jgi:hypothetical protein